MDIQITNEGSLYLIRPLTRAGTRWVALNIGPDNGYQPYYPTIVVEPRYVDDIYQGMLANGLGVDYE